MGEYQLIGAYFARSVLGGWTERRSVVESVREPCAKRDGGFSGASQRYSLRRCERKRKVCARYFARYELSDDLSVDSSRRDPATVVTGKSRGKVAVMYGDLRPGEKFKGEHCRAVYDEFPATTGYHRKHAMRLLRGGVREASGPSRPRRRRYDDRVRDALIVLWEAGDRICGKRLKALMPILVTAMERHGHLRLEAEVRAALLAMSAATIDRVLQGVRPEAKGRCRRRSSVPPHRTHPRRWSPWPFPPSGLCRER